MPVPPRSPLVAAYVFVTVMNANLGGFYALAPTFRDELGLSGTERDILFSGPGLVMLTLALPLGNLSDRLGARRVSLAAIALLAVSALGHAVAVDFWSLLGARLVFAVAFTGMLTASIAWLSESVGAGARARAIGGVMPIAGLGLLGGPYLAGALVDASGTELAYGVLCGLSAFSLGLALASRAGERSAVQRTPLGLTLRALGEPVVAAAVVLTLLGIVVDVVLNLLVPEQLDENGLSAGQRGAVLSAGGIVYVLVAVICVRMAHRLVNIRTAGVAAVLCGLVFAPLALSEATGPQAAGMIVRGAVLALLFTVSYPLGALGAHAAGTGMGVAAGLVMLATGVANTVAPIGAGRAAEAIGSTGLYAGLGAASVLAGAWMLTVARRAAARERAARAGQPALGSEPS
jgi:predicted MFS family arabinose efflux permease